MNELSFSEIGAVSGGKTSRDLSYDEITSGMAGGFLGIALAVNIPMTAGFAIKLLGCFGATVFGVNIGYILCHLAFPENYKNS